MSPLIDALFDGAVLHLDSPLPLPPNTRVRVMILVIDPADAPPASFLQTARTLALDAPPDFAMNIETYLYDTPSHVVH